MPKRISAESSFSSFNWGILIGLLIHIGSSSLQGQPPNSVRYVDFKDKSLGITSTITSDRDGFVWLSTAYGLVRYDGTSFTNIVDLMANPPPLDQRAQHLYVDSFNQLWFYRSTMGLYRIDLNTLKWRFYPTFNIQRVTSFSHSFYEHPQHDLFIPHESGLAHYVRQQDSFELIPVTDIDDDLQYVVGTAGDELLVASRRQVFKFDLKTRSTTPVDPLENAGEGIIADIGIDKNGDLWISNWYSDVQGLICFDLKHNRVKQIFGNDGSGQRYISNTDIWQILPDNEGVFFATNAGGVWYYDCDKDRMLQIKHQTGAQKNSTDQVRAIHKDHFDRLWLGSSVDVYMEVPHSKPISQIVTNPAGTGIPSNNIFTVAAISTGELGVGSDEGLSLHDRNTGMIRNKVFPNYNNNRYNNQVNHIFEYEGDLWVGTWSGLIRINLKTLKVAEYYVTFANAGNNHDPAVMKFEIGAPFQTAIDQDRNLWVLNDRKGLIRITGRQNQRRIHTYDLLGDSEVEPCLSMLYHSTRGLIAVSPGKLWSYNRSDDQFDRLILTGDTLPNHPNTQLYQTENNRLFLFSGNELFLLDFLTMGTTLMKIGQVAGYHDLDHLIIDRHNVAWMTEREGIVRWNLDNGHLLHLDAELFLFSASINKMIDIKKATLDRDGFLSYATNNGVVQINTNDFTINTNTPKIVLTSIESDDKAVSPSPVHLLKNLVLRHDQNNLHIAYSILNDSEPATRSFAYRLNKSAEWIHVGNQSSVYLSGLAPGTYSFELTGKNSDGISTVDPLVLAITIKPPWYRSLVAYAFYLLMTALLIMILYRFRLNTTLAKKEAERIKELDQFKNRFFTNITHEFRTPLTVISGMAGKIEESPEKWSDKGARLIKRNSKTLLHLINQLLDLSKLEQGMIKRKLIQDDIIGYLRYLTQSFQSHADGARQKLVFQSDQDRLLMDFDEHHIETILSNLISNAIKYSDEPGEIIIAIHTDYESKSPMLKLQIQDQGVGIDEDHLPHIFDRYYRVDDKMSAHEVGSGIGLALVKELVEKSGGSLQVASEVGKGSTFTVTLPVTKNAIKQDVKRPPIDIEAPEIGELAVSNHETSILIVEDNDDVAEYIRTCLAEDYHCRRARDGIEGLEKALSMMPDLIVSDVMMPKMSGTEMVMAIRQDSRVDHIPVIMLTAKVDLEARIEGIEQGADAYLGKPFAEKELLVQIKRLITQQKTLRERFKNQNELSPDLGLVAARNQKYIGKLRAIITDHLDDATFGVEELAREVHLSGRQLARKLKAISKLTANQLIKEVRIDKAKELLLTTDKNITEIAFEVGFSSSQYFATVFKKEVGSTPGEYVQATQTS